MNIKTVNLKLNSGYVLLSRRREPVLGEELESYIVLQANSEFGSYKNGDVVVVEQSAPYTKFEDNYIFKENAIIAKYE